MKIVEYEESYRERWSAYINKSERSNIAHEIGWRQVMHTGLGHRPFYLLALENDEVLGVLPAVLVKTFWGAKYMISLPWIDYGGICADSIDVERALEEEGYRVSDSVNARFMELRSIKAGAGTLHPGEGKVTFLLELKDGPDIIFKNIDGKLRNQIRKSQKSGLVTEFGTKELLDDFYQIFSWKMHDLGTPVWGKEFFEAIFKSFSGSARIILVKKDGRAIAGGLVLAFKDRLYVPSAAAYNSALKYCPNHALYWATIEKGCEEGYSYFDFGRSKIDSNTYRFKMQWVPTPTELHWQYYLPRSEELPSINPANPKYKLFINIWKRLPLPLANLLGPRVIRNFP